MSAYTPGPWATDEAEHDEPYQDILVMAGEHRRICKVSIDDAPVHDYNAAQRANARLIAAAPTLVECLTMGATMQTPEFLEWLADRLVTVYGEDPGTDFVLSLRDRAGQMRAARLLALGEQ